MDLVVCSLEAWDDVWRRNQFLVRELLRRQPDLRVLFVEPPVDVLHPPSWGGRLPAGGLRQVEGHDRLWALRPVKVIPRVVRSPVERGLVRQVRWAASRLGWRRPALWVNDTRYADLVDRTGWPAVYDVTDDWLEADVPPRDRARRRAQEQRLLASAAAVTVCSPSLAASRGEVGSVVLIPNAVDAVHFRAPRPRPADLPPAPTAVYVGTLHEDRLDVDLCVEMALKLPELTLVLVGPDALAAQARERLADLPNVRLAGPRPYDGVPAYLQHADVVVVPHAVSPFTESLDPIKAYECVAVGRPTVATPVAGFRDLGPPVVVVPPDQFVEAVQTALENPNPVVEVEVRRVASWADRAEQFAEILEKADRARPAQGRDRLRVVYLDDSPAGSESRRALTRLVSALSPAVAASVILAEPDPADELVAAGAAVSVLPIDAGARAVGTARYVGALRQRLRELGPDLVHTNSSNSAIPGGLAGRLAGIPVVWHIRDHLAPSAPRFLFHLLPSVVIAGSRATAARLWASGGGPPVHVIDDGAPGIVAARVLAAYDSLAPAADRHRAQRQ